jgi:hypothetical protein
MNSVKVEVNGFSSNFDRFTIYPNGCINPGRQILCDSTRCLLSSVCKLLNVTSNGAEKVEAFSVFLKKISYPWFIGT